MRWENFHLEKLFLFCLASALFLFSFKTASATTTFLVNSSTDWDAGTYTNTTESNGILELKTFLGDGDMDIPYVSNGGYLMYYDIGIGSSTNTTENAQYTKGVGDIGGDEDIDIAYIDTNDNLMYYDTGSGSSTNTGKDAYKVGEIADIEGDGDMDIAYATLNAYLVYYDVSSDSLTNTTKETYLVGGVADIEGDGDMDIAYRDTSSNLMYYDIGAGTSTDTGQDTYYVGGVADIGGDGDMDIAYGDTGNYLVYYNISSGSSTDTTKDTDSVGGVTDIGGDGDMDIAYSSSNDYLMYYDTGSGSSTNTTLSVSGGANHVGEIADIGSHLASFGNYQSKTFSASIKQDWKNFTSTRVAGDVNISVCTPNECDFFSNIGNQTSSLSLDYTKNISFNISMSSEVDSIELQGETATGVEANAYLPKSGEILSSDTPSFKGMANDTIGSKTISWFNLTIDGTQVYSNGSYTAGTNITVSPVTLNDGSHSYYWTAEDGDGYKANSTEKSFTTDTVPPSISIFSPAEGDVFFETSSVFLNHTESDVTTSVDYCKYSVDGGANQTLSSCSNTTLTGLADSSHDVKLWANDSAGNWGNLLHNFEVNFAPSVNLEKPGNFTYVLNQTAEYWFNLTDKGDDTLSCGLYIDQATYGDNSSVQNATSTSIRANHTVDYGNREWYVNCSDDYNTTQSEIWIARVRKRNPISITIDPNTSVEVGTETEAECTTGSGYFTFRRNGIMVSSPDISVLQVGDYNYTCLSKDNMTYARNYTSKNLTVYYPELGCYSKDIHAFKKDYNTTNIDILAINFSKQVESGRVQKKLQDVYIVGEKYKNILVWRNETTAYANVTKADNIGIYFGNEFGNRTYDPFYESSSIVDEKIELSEYKRLRPYLEFETYMEKSSKKRYPPETNVTLAFYCGKGQRQEVKLEYNNTYVLMPKAVGSEFESLKFYINYENSSYYRQIMPEVSGSTYRRIWFADATQYPIVQSIFNLKDKAGNYGNSILEAKKVIKNKEETISEVRWDISGRVIMYLIDENTYHLSVKKPEENVYRDIGDLVVSSLDPTKTIVITGMVEEMKTFSDFLSYKLETFNTSIRLNWNDSSGELNYANFTVMNASNKSQIFCDKYSTASSGTLKCTGLNPNGTYKIIGNFSHPDLGWKGFEKIRGLKKRVGGFMPQLSGRWKAILATGFLMFVGLCFGALVGSLGAIVVAVFSAIFKFIGWLPLPWTVVAFVSFLSVVAAIANKGVGGGAG